MSLRIFPKLTGISKCLILLLSGCFFLISCNKPPVADFSMDRAEYSAGEVVKLTNKSTDAETYKWTLPDGQTSTSKNVNYTINALTMTGGYSVKLEVKSKNGKKTDTATKNYTLK